MLNSDGADKDSHSQQHLANERTFLAWLRTCIALLGLGFVVARFGLYLQELTSVMLGGNSSSISINTDTIKYQESSSLIGIGFIILGIVLLLFALRSYTSTYKALENKQFKSRNFNIYAAAISFMFLSIIVIIYLAILYIY